MNHTLTLNLPEEVYTPLLEKARAERRTPEEVAIDCLAAYILPDKEDPLLQMLGSLEAEVTDLGARHDDYITEALTCKRRGQSGG